MKFEKIYYFCKANLTKYEEIYNMPHGGDAGYGMWRVA